MALGTIKPSQKDCHKDTGNQYTEICDRLHLILSIILSKKIKYGFYIKVTPVAGMGADAKKGNNRSSGNSSEVSGEGITPITVVAGHYKGAFVSLSNWIKLNIQKNLCKKRRSIYALGSVEIYPYRMEYIIKS